MSLLSERGEKMGVRMSFSGWDTEMMAFVSRSRNVVYRDGTAAQECRRCSEEVVVVSRGSLAADSEGESGLYVEREEHVELLSFHFNEQWDDITITAYCVTQQQYVHSFHYCISVACKHC